MSPSEDLEFRATQDVDIPCMNCGHERSFHVRFRSGAKQPCDYDNTPLDAFIDTPPELCGCTEYIPMTVSDIQEISNQEAI